MLILHDPDTLLHETVELLGARTIPALDSPARIRAIVETVSHSTHSLEYVESPLKSGSTELQRLFDLTRRTHNQDYLKHLGVAFKSWRDANLIQDNESILPECFAFTSKAHPRPPSAPPKDIFARPGFFAFDMSSGIMRHTDASAIASANLAVQGIDRLKAGVDGTDVLALCRPPGHHCDGSKAGGYCYINNAAVAVSTWRSYAESARISILDLDFHHGNGTQDIFFADPVVFYASIHGKDEFPYYTGGQDEKGIGNGVGANLNLPLPKGSSFEDYQNKLDLALDAISIFRPEMMIVSLGFDTFHLDPLGSFDIDTSDYETMARRVRLRIPDLPSLLILEGGYSIEHLGDNLLSFLEGWEMKT